MQNKSEFYKTFCTVDLDRLAHNYNYTKKGCSCDVICVIKANAYGHGAIPVAKRLEKEGCSFFAVSSFEEAMELRNCGIGCDILILGYVFPCQIDSAIKNDISFAAASLDFIKELSKHSVDSKKARIHIKLNTGMNRTGFNVCESDIPQDLADAVKIIKENPHVEVEGLFSHFAKADENDKDFTNLQFSRYQNTKTSLVLSGITPKICHICNSAGTCLDKDMHLDAVRLGIYLYGCESSDKNYLPVMDFCTRIIEINTLQKGDGVSYGLDFKADKQMKVAIIGAGYADGLSRHLSNSKGYVLCHGKKCAILGRVCMDMTMIDISDIHDAKVGDIVTIWGENEGEVLTCDKQSRNASTIAYELLCSVSPRVHRVYKENK